MSNVNRIILVGRVVAEVELRYTTEGSALAKFRMAVDRPRRPDGDQKTDFINIVAWNKLGEICAEYLKKGKLILVEGRIQVRSFETDNGTRRYVTEIIAQNMRMLESVSPRTESPAPVVSEQISPTVEHPPESIPGDNPEPANQSPIPEEPQVPVESNATEGLSPQPENPGMESVPSPDMSQEPFYTEDDIPF